MNWRKLDGQEPFGGCVFNLARVSAERAITSNTTATGVDGVAVRAKATHAATKARAAVR
jgi:hypothetical protein